MKLKLKQMEEYNQELMKKYNLTREELGKAMDINVGISWMKDKKGNPIQTGEEMANIRLDLQASAYHKMKQEGTLND